MAGREARGEKGSLDGERARGEGVKKEMLVLMKIRRGQAELALELAALPVHTGGRGHPSKTTPARERICQQITDLNRRGQ